jgi:hypothetical protein
MRIQQSFSRSRVCSGFSSAAAPSAGRFYLSDAKPEQENVLLITFPVDLILFGGATGDHPRGKRSGGIGAGPGSFLSGQRPQPR